MPTVPKYMPSSCYPAVPLALQRTPGAARIDLGWRYLQSDDLSSAEREFSAALKQSPGLVPRPGRQCATWRSHAATTSAP